MPADDLEVLIPGNALEATVDDTPLDLKDARIAELEATVAQLSAALSAANEQLKAVQTVPSRSDQPNTGPRLIGEDWSSKTSAEAMAAGINRPVMCSDGYYVP